MSNITSASSTGSNDPAVSVTASPTGLTRSQRFIVLAIAIFFSALPLFYIGDLTVSGLKITDLDASGFFFSLGLLPGAIAIVYQIVSASTRRRQGREMLQQYYAFRNSRAQTRPQEKLDVAPDEGSSDPLGAIAAALFLTGIFLLIAVFAGFEASQQSGAVANGVQGMMYAGLGAYVAVLYYMVARLYANALSSRFLITSALRTASAVAIGWVFGIVGVTAFAGASEAANAAPTSASALGSNAVLFMVGLFHNMAIDALRRRAVKLFGATEDAADNLSATAVEGIDDTTAELLSEYGIASIQHLSTVEPAVLCDATLLPLDRVLDWMDQALLIRSLRRTITIARGMGIRGAIDLATIHYRGDEKLLASLADKIGMPPEAVNHIALELRSDYVVALIYELQQGRPFPAALTDEPAAVQANAPVASTRAQQSTTAQQSTPMLQIRDEGATLSATQS